MSPDSREEVGHCLREKLIVLKIIIVQFRTVVISAVALLDTYIPPNPVDSKGYSHVSVIAFSY